MNRLHHLIQLSLIGTILLFSNFLQAQSITVKGFVLADDEPAGLIGVNIIIKGTFTGTTTDFDGTFQLDLSLIHI